MNKTCPISNLISDEEAGIGFSSFSPRKVFGSADHSGADRTHHALRHIQTGPGKVGLTVHIDHAAARAAVRSHSKAYLRMFFESATDLKRAFHRLFRALVKNQRHPVAGRDLDQSGRGFSVLKLLGRANGLSQFVNRRTLLVNRKLRVANDVDEQDMGDLELDLFLDLSGHGWGESPIGSGRLLPFVYAGRGERH